MSLTSILGRAAAAEDAEEFWRARQPFIDLLPYFRQFHDAAAKAMPSSMAHELGRLVQMAEAATDAPEEFHRDHRADSPQRTGQRSAAHGAVPAGLATT